jgi:hypothetical protein
MSTTTALRRLAAGSAIAAGALLAILGLTPGSAPAHATGVIADSVEVGLNGVSGSITAGSRLPDPISVEFRNRTNSPITSIRPIFTIQLAGLPADGVQIVRALGSPLPSEAAGDGTVRLSDPSTFELLRDGRRTVVYTLQFTESAPAGKATITVEAYSGDKRLGGDSTSVTIRGTAPTRTTPPNTNPGVIPTFAPGTSYAIATPPPDEQTLAGSDMPISLYVLGGVLVSVGGIVLYLLFRRQRPLADAGAYPIIEHDQARPSSLGYPRHSAVVRPTAVMPTVRDAEPPWSHGTMPEGPMPHSPLPQSPMPPDPHPPRHPGPHSIPRDPWA